MPYNLPPRLLPKDIPLPCSKDVESILEVDRLFWLDPRNAMRQQFERRLVPGEERPYELPTGNDTKGIPLVDVIVQRWGRTFLSSGRVVLQIVDNPPPKSDHKKIKPAKKEQDHGIKGTLESFRKFMGEYFQQVQKDRGRSVAVQPDAAARKAQSEQDKQRLQEIRRTRAAARAALTESKRQRGKNERKRANGGASSAP